MSCKHGNLKRWFTITGESLVCPDCQTRPGDVLRENWAEGRREARLRRSQWWWMYVVFTGRQWMGLAVAFGSGWFFATDQLTHGIGAIMACLFAVAALLVVPPFDFIRQMIDGDDD